MKTIILGLFLFTVQVFFAQEYYHLDQEAITSEALGFSEPVKQVEVSYYKGDDSGYETTMVEVYFFDDNNRIVTKYMRIFGDYASETSHQYRYKDQKLDSLNTYSSAASFNSKSQFKYKGDKIVGRTGTGVYTNYEDTYTYDSNNRLKQIKRVFPKGNSSESNYTYTNGELSLVEEISTNIKGHKDSTFFYYLDNKVVAKYNPVFNSIVFYDVNMANYTTNTVDKPLPLIERYLNIRKTGSREAIRKFMDESVGQAEIVKQNLASSANMKGDWLSRYQMTSNYGNEIKCYIFRKITYANGEVSGSTDFNYLFQHKTKGL